MADGWTTSLVTGVCTFAAAGGSAWLTARFGSRTQQAVLEEGRRARQEQLEADLAAERRTVERDAAARVSEALVKVRMTAFAPRSKWHQAKWHQEMRPILQPVENALMYFRDAEVRDRLTQSFDLIVYGPQHEQLQHIAKLNDRLIVLFAYRDAMAVLGAAQREEPVPEPEPEWTRAAEAQAAIIREIERSMRGE